MQGHNPRKGQGPWLKGISDTFPSIIPYVFLSTFIWIKKKIFTYEYSGSPVRRVLPSCRPHSNCEALEERLWNLTAEIWLLLTKGVNS